MPNIIVDKITRKETAKFGELKPGTVFQFTERCQIGKYYLFIQPIELGLSRRNKVKCAVQLYGNFDTILAADNEDVVIVDAEFHVNNQRGDIYET